MIGFKRSKGVVRRDGNPRTRTSCRAAMGLGMVVAILYQTWNPADTMKDLDQRGNVDGWKNGTRRVRRWYKRRRGRDVRISKKIKVKQGSRKKGRPLQMITVRLREEGAWSETKGRISRVRPSKGMCCQASGR